MGVALALLVILAGGCVAARMARVRDKASARAYTLLIGLITVLGACVLVHIHLAGLTMPGALIPIASAWMGCSVASMNRSVNPGIALLYALMFTTIVTIGFITGGHQPASWVSTGFAASWLVTGWLIRLNRLNPGALPLIVIVASLLYLQSAW